MFACEGESCCIMCELSGNQGNKYNKPIVQSYCTLADIPNHSCSITVNIYMQVICHMHVKY